jgi:hypothetical protein
MKKVLFSLAASSFALGCTFMARGPEDYRADTRAVVETRTADIQSCYDSALKADKKLAGSVIVHFTVEHETGAIKEASVLPESTAPESLGTCIVNALNGLTLDPPDERDGDATFVWEFRQAATPAPASADGEARLRVSAPTAG